MAYPTLEELQQQIDELKSLITTQYEPPTGNEYSYPVVNQPMNDEMWQYVTLAMGNGILDEGGQPYWLRGRENVNNTLKITVATTTGTAQGVVRGFYHRLTEDKSFTVPGVSSTTVYHFCLTYDPTASTTPGGPISLQMYAGTPPTTLGRFHVILWTLTRQPNQLLTDAAIVQHRPKVVSRISVGSPDYLPDARGMLWGGEAVVSHGWEKGALYTVSGVEDGVPTSWESVTDPAWENLSYIPTYRHPGHGYRLGIQRVGKRRFLRGRVARDSGANFVSGSGGYWVCTLPVGDRPSQEVRLTISGAGFNPPNQHSVVINTDGEVRAYMSTNVSWYSLDGVWWDKS